MPSLEELTIFLQSHGRIADIILSDDMLGSTIPIGLHSISLYNCMMPWSSPLLTANIRLLDLSNEDLPDTAALPSPSLFHDVLSRLTVLEELTLMNIFPVFNDNDNQPITTNLPESLRNVELSATILPMVTPCLKAFLSLATSRSAGYNVNICAVADDALISKALTHLFQSAPDPPTELHITCNSFSTLLPPEWSAGDPEVGLEWLNSESETDCCLERRFTLEDNESDTLSSLFRSPFSSAVRLDTVKWLSIASSAIPAFPDADAWRTMFTAAAQVSCLAVPYAPGLHHLLCALEDALPDPDAEKLALFPELAVIALYPYVDNDGDPIDVDAVDIAHLRLELPNCLHIRRDSGAALKTLRVEKGVLGEEERQALAEIVTVELF